MTQQEKDQMRIAILTELKANAKSVASVPKAEGWEDLDSLPVTTQDGTLVRADISEIKGAVDSANEAAQSARQALTEITNIIADNVPMKFLSLEDYEAIQSKGRVLYFIMRGNILRYIYLGTTLIAKRGGADLPEGFPYTFPIIF